MNIFIYGTLRDPIVFRNLTGTDLNGVPFDLRGFRVDRVKDSDLPMILPSADHVATGLLLRDPDPEVIDRLHAYEVPFGYVPVTLDQDGQSVTYYQPPDGQQTSGQLWDLAVWQSESALPAQFAAAEIRSINPPLTGDQLVAQWGMIQHRAHTAARAATHSAPSTVRRAAGRAEVVNNRLIAGDFFRFRGVDLRYETFDGGVTDPLPREVFQGGEAALILPYDPVRDTVLLVEQFRVGSFFRGDGNPWMLEPVAGLIDAGETPREAAIRECAEEANVTPSHIELMYGAYPSPGGSTEYHHCFVGIVDLPESDSYFGGLEDEAEDLKLHVLPFEKVMELVTTGEICVLPLIGMLYWLDRNRARLRPAG